MNRCKKRSGEKKLLSLKDKINLFLINTILV